MGTNLVHHLPILYTIINLFEFIVLDNIKNKSKFYIIRPTSIWGMGFKEPYADFSNMF